MKRGVTLVEMLITITVLGLVSSLALSLLLRQQWTGEAQSQRAAVQSTLRAAQLYLASELRELGGAPGDPDILVFAAESLTYRASRSSGVACSVGPNAIVVEQAQLSGYRQPQPGRDSLLLLADGAPSTSADDRWVHLPILATSAGSCSGRPALIFATAIDTALTPLSSFPPLAPFHSFEIMQLRLYSSAGDYWLGARSISAGEIIQPFAGPFQIHGLALSFFDSLGAAAATGGDIRDIGITLRAVSSVPVRNAGLGSPQRISDSVLTRFALRNWQ